MIEVPLKINEPRHADVTTSASGSAAGRSRPSIVLAHGAGAGMDSPFMEDVAEALSASYFRVVRFEFPYMQEFRETHRRTRPDPPAVLEATWTHVVEQLGGPAGLVIGGKSMGGRIASMVADRLGVRGLVCLGYPFHPTGAPSALRVSHLRGLSTPALFLQGERDALGGREEIAGYELSPAIRLVFLADGDHSFKPRKSSGHTYEENLQKAIEEIVAFCGKL